MSSAYDARPSHSEHNAIPVVGPRGRRLLAAASFAWIFVPLGLFVASRRHDDIAKLFSYGGSDRTWCPFPDQLLGNHCFSDHGIIPLYTYGNDVWGGMTPAPTPTPAAAMGFHWLVYEVGRLLGSDIFGTVLFLAVSFLCMLTPFFWATRGIAWSTRAQAFLIMGLGAYPVLINLDRAQLTGFLVLPVFLATLRFLRGEYASSAILIGIAATFKPQFILLVILFIAVRRLSPVVIALATMGAGLLTSFMLFPGDKLNNMSSWLHNMISYSNYGNENFDLGLLQLSTHRTIEVLARTLSEVAPSAQGIALRLVGISPILVGLVILGVTLFVVAIAGPRIPALGLILIAVCMVILVPGTTFIYYSVLWVVVIAFILRNPLRPGSTSCLGLMDLCEASPLPKSLAWFTTGFLVLSVVPLAIPLTILTNQPTGVRAGLLPTLAGPATVLLWIAWLAYGASRVRHRGIPCDFVVKEVSVP